MGARILALRDFLRADHLARQRPASAPAVCLDELGGRLTELSGHGAGARYTQVSRLLLEAQREGAPVAWIGVGRDVPYPPDLARAGLDLAALPFVTTSDATAASGAAIVLARSGAFRVVVVDLLVLRESARVSAGALSRLSGLARTHEMAIVFLTLKAAGQPSLHSLISLRAETARARDRRHGYRCTFAALKDKQRGPGWTSDQPAWPPPGLE